MEDTQSKYLNSHTFSNKFPFSVGLFKSKKKGENYCIFTLEKRVSVMGSTVSYYKVRKMTSLFHIFLSLTGGFNVKPSESNF